MDLDIIIRSETKTGMDSIQGFSDELNNVHWLLFLYDELECHKQCFDDK
jgi:hypothetical protein